MLIQTLLEHGVQYHYRFHTKKVNGEISIKPFVDFCKAIPESCPHDYFFNGPRSSVLKFKIGIDPLHIRGHPMEEFARLGLEEFKDTKLSNHDKVQTFLLHHDPNTAVLELPLWLEKEEQVPLVDGQLTGHVDIIRVEGDNVWIWDYKPNAIKEKYAATQIFYYALMLEKRTGIPLENIRCAYFDATDTFMFKPAEVKINSQLNNFELQTH